MIELVFNPRPGEGTEFGIDHLAFMTDDLEGDYQRLIDAGFAADEAPKRAGTGNGTLAFLRRPDGARLELLERDVDFRVPETAGGLVKGFDHYAYRVDDLDEAEKFFAKTIGMAHLQNMPTSGGKAHDPSTTSATTSSVSVLLGGCRWLPALCASSRRRGPGP